MINSELGQDILRIRTKAASKACSIPVKFLHGLKETDPGCIHRWALGFSSPFHLACPALSHTVFVPFLVATTGRPPPPPPPPPPYLRCPGLRRRRAATRYAHAFYWQFLNILASLTRSNPILLRSEVRDRGRWPCSHPPTLPSAKLPVLGRASGKPQRIPLREGFSTSSSSHVPLRPMHSDTTRCLYLIPTLLIDFILDLY